MASLRVLILDRFVSGGTLGMCSRNLAKAVFILCRVHLVAIRLAAFDQNDKKVDCKLIQATACHLMLMCLPYKYLMITSPIYSAGLIGMMQSFLKPEDLQYRSEIS